MRNSCILFFLSICLGVSCRQRSTVEKVRELNDYSSGSGMAFFDKKIYLMGDDMNYLLVMDTTLTKTDTIQLLPGTGRIPKHTKADLESVSVFRKQKSSFLLLLGSGSVLPARAHGWVVNIRNREKTFLNLEPFYKRILANGIKELNIEGAAAISGGMVLANRGNKSYPKNYLVFTSSDFWQNQESASIRIIKLGASSDTSIFNGVSGMDYSYRSDKLIITVSTENTYSAQADGSIGKSYLWIIDNISSKKRLTAVNPNRIIDLEKIDQSFKGHKIESVCILSETKTDFLLDLVADDDKGTSILFTLKLSKRDDIGY